MKPRILVTTTSFQDTPGPHHDMLGETGWDIVTARGPLSEADTLSLVGEVDGYICGDDAITRSVLQKASPRLKVLSKYGIGVDKIDVAAATEMGVPLLFTPGVNHTTVAEHTFLLLLALEKHLLFHADSTRQGGWDRKTGREILGKTIGIVGMGRIGKEVAVRARAFGMKPIGYDVYWTKTLLLSMVWNDVRICLICSLGLIIYHFTRISRQKLVNLFVPRQLSYSSPTRYF